MRSVVKVLFASMITMLSCQEREFFDQEKQIATRVNEPLSSVAKLDQVVNGTYWMMIGIAENGWTNPYDNYKTWNSLGSDAFTVTSPQHPRYRNQEGSYPWHSRTLNHFLTNDEGRLATPRAWTICYSNISNVNLVINLVEDALPGLPFQDEQIDDLPRVVGEAYFLRGYHHWMVDQIFGKAYRHEGDNVRPSIIIRRRNSQGLQDANMALSTVQEVSDFLIADFDSAAVHLPDDVGLGRASRPAAEAMLARVFLSRGNWQGAADYAGKVIDNYGFTLEADPLNIYARSAADESSEVIWEHQWGFGHQFPRVGYITPIQCSFYNWVERRSFGFAGPIDTQYRTNPMSKSILQKIGWMETNGNETDLARNDKRYQQVYHRADAGADFRLEALTGGSISEPHVWVFKDCRTSADTNNGTDFSDELYNPRVHVPLIRLSEMYLTRAIARARLGDEAGALQDLNTIRERAWDPTAGTFQPLSAGNYGIAGSLEEAIEIERIRELTGEGDRLYYLKSMNMQVPAGDRDASPLPFDDDGLVWPLPPDEEDLNESI